MKKQWLLFNHQEEKQLKTETPERASCVNYATDEVRNEKERAKMEMTRERKILINKIDVEYRDITNFDNQFEVMSYILNCLSDEQLNTAKKLIKVWKQQERKG